MLRNRKNGLEVSCDQNLHLLRLKASSAQLKKLLPATGTVPENGKRARTHEATPREVDRIKRIFLPSSMPTVS